MGSRTPTQAAVATAAFNELRHGMRAEQTVICAQAPLSKIITCAVPQFLHTPEHLSPRSADRARTPPGGPLHSKKGRFSRPHRFRQRPDRPVERGLRPRRRRQYSSDIEIARKTHPHSLLSTRSVFDTKGIRELEEFGPLRRVTLTGTGTGESAAAGSWTVNEYDAGRPTDGTAKVANQVTKVTTGAQVLGTSTMADARVTQTLFDWVKGLPIKTIKDPAGLAITETTKYDTLGRVTKQMLPGATGTDAGTRVTTYWSATGTGTCQGRPEWADQVCSTGPAGAITGGGTNPSQLPTTTNTYDNAGRQTKAALTGGLGQAVPEATTEYDPATGQAVKTTSPTGGTITREYDKLGRLISYTDTDDSVTRTEYDLLDRPVKATDSAPSTVTYTYDTTVEPRGLATKTTDSIAGAFEARYDADGSVATEKLPGGYTLTITEDTTGATLSRVYTRDSDGQVVYSDTVDESVHGQVTRHSGWSGQDYTYDATGRLTQVNDTAGDVCTARSYGFDKRTNRTGLTTAEGTPGAVCPTTGGTTTTHTYDSADRLTDAGYVYDAFGRTTALPGSQIGYYANDLVHQQTANGQRQT